MSPDPATKAERPLEGLEALYGPIPTKEERLAVLKALRDTKWERRCEALYALDDARKLYEELQAEWEDAYEVWADAAEPSP